MAKPDGIRPKTSKDPEVKKMLASQDTGKRHKKSGKQTPALLQSSTASILDKDELLELCAKGELATGHQFRITDKDGTHADFVVDNRGESHIYTYANGNAPEFAAYSGYKGIFIYPQFPMKDDFISPLDGPAAELQGLIVDYFRENFTEDELRLLAGQLPKEKPSLDLGPMFASVPGSYGIDNKVGFRLFDGGNLKVVFVSSEIAGDEWAELHGVFLPMWKLSKNAADFRAFNEPFDKYSDKAVLSMALGKKLLEIADSLGIEVKPAEKPKKDKVRPESNTDLTTLFDGETVDQYSVEDGNVGLRAYPNGDIAVVFTDGNYKGDWEPLFHVNISRGELVNAEQFAEATKPTADADTKEKRLYLGKLLIDLAKAGGYEVKPVPAKPEPEKVFVGNGDKVTLWGEAEKDMEAGFGRALDAEYTDCKIVNFRIGGTSPNDGMVISIKAERAGFKMTPVMIGEKHPLSNKIEQGCFIFATGGLIPEKETVAAMQGKWKESLTAFVEYLLDDPNGRAIISPLSTGHGALKKKREVERAAQSKRDKERAEAEARKLALATVDGKNVRGPQYGGVKQPVLPRKAVSTPKPQAPAVVQQSTTGNMVSEGLAIAAQNMSPEKYAELLLNLSGKQDKSA